MWAVELAQQGGAPREASPGTTTLSSCPCTSSCRSSISVAGVVAWLARVARTTVGPHRRYDRRRAPACAASGCSSRLSACWAGAPLPGRVRKPAGSRPTSPRPCVSWAAGIWPSGSNASPGERVRQTRGGWWPVGALLWLLAFGVFLRLLMAGRAFRGTDLASLGDSIGLSGQSPRRARRPGLGADAQGPGTGRRHLVRRLLGLGLVGLLGLLRCARRFSLPMSTTTTPSEPMVYATARPTSSLSSRS